MSLPSDVTVDNLKDFYAMILPYLNVGNGGTSDTPLGQVAFFDDVVAPAGWLIADGTVYNISDYPDLANQYERVHGSKNFYGGNGTTTFAVPNWQGEFLRASGMNSHANQGSGANVGVHQDGTTIEKQTELGTTINYSNADKTITKSQSFYSANNNASGTKEVFTSRPTNTSLLLCIKAVPSSEMNTYSTTERRVGTWIDGKELQQRTFVLQSAMTVPANTQWYDTGMSNDGIDEIVNLSSVRDGVTTLWGCVNIDKGTSTLVVQNTRSANITLKEFTLQYTKTTD